MELLVAAVAAAAEAVPVEALQAHRQSTQVAVAAAVVARLTQQTQRGVPVAVPAVAAFMAGPAQVRAVEGLAVRAPFLPLALEGLAEPFLELEGASAVAVASGAQTAVPAGLGLVVPLPVAV